MSIFCNIIYRVNDLKSIDNNLIQINKLLK